MTTTITLASQFVLEDCCRAGCGITFAMPYDLVKALRADHSRTFYCPNGHPMHYTGKTPEQHLKDELAAMERNRDTWVNAHDQVTRERDLTRRQLSAAKGRITRMRNRIANGVCPVPGCKRSGLGADVVAHIATMHPDWHDHETPVDEPSSL